MKNLSTTRRNGFVLIEALVALLIIVLGVVGITQLQTLSIFGASEAKARSEAMALSQVKLETLRNLVEKSKFTGDPMVSSEDPASHSGKYATYSMSWTVETPADGLEQRVLKLTTTWKDSRGLDQEIVLNSVIAWDDPALQASASAGLGSSLISPTGSAKRKDMTVEGQGSGVYTDPETKNTYLLDSSGKVLLYLSPENGVAQQFATISGKIFFDQGVNNGIPNSSDVRVRLSSEGECIYNNTVLTAASGGGNTYKYFSYVCYVGPGWYGNVGVLVDADVNGNAANPTICLGDPGFNGGASNGTLVSAHPLESATRSYRGFKGTTGNYRSTGMKGDSAYGLTTGTTPQPPFDGRPRPSEYPSYYPSIAAGSSNDYFEQNFLITKKVTGNDSCMSKMSGGVFARNAGKYVCINPDNDNGADDVCPVTWPGFESQVGTGNGSINYAVTVTRQGSGTVTSSSGGINCGTLCSASYPSGTTVTLTATPVGGATFNSWTGCSPTTGTTCTVSVDSLKEVTAQFTGGPSDFLTVTQVGSGSGTVTSSPAGIDCGASCSSSFSNGASVTLTAMANSGSTFTGWSGNCTDTGTGSCTVSVNGATSVSANFALSGGPVCTTPISGSAVDKHGTVTVTASACTTSGNSCSCALDGGNNSNYSCSFTLPQGTIVTLTNAKTNGNNGNPTYSHSKSVTANCTAQTNVDFP